LASILIEADLGRSYLGDKRKSWCVRVWINKEKRRHYTAHLKGNIMEITNDYLSASEADAGLFAVQLSDGGYSVADGPGTRLSKPDEIDVAGYHLPVKFKDEESAIAAIKTGPDAWFDIAITSSWTEHCLKNGAVANADYLQAHRQLVGGAGKNTKRV